MSTTLTSKVSSTPFTQGIRLLTAPFLLHISPFVAIPHLSSIHLSISGACEGSIACSTCHVILSPEHYDLLEEPSDDENDMLDMAFGLTDTSRLGCQVCLTKAMEGMNVQLPSATRNMFVDGELAHLIYLMIA